MSCRKLTEAPEHENRRGHVTARNSRLSLSRGVRSTRSLQQLLQTFTITAARRETGTALENDHVIALEQRLELADLVDTNDGRAMDADEVRRIQLRFQRSHRFAQQVFLATRMQAHVIRRGFDPVDFIDAQNDDATTGTHNEALDELTACAQLLE